MVAPTLTTGKSLRSMRKGAPRDVGGRVGESGGSTRKFNRGKSGSATKTPNQTPVMDERDEGKKSRTTLASKRSTVRQVRSISGDSIDSIGREITSSPVPRSPMRRFTRNRSSEEEKGTQGKDLGASIIRTSPKSNQSDVSPPRFVAKPISPHHPQNFRNASKFREEREKRELATKLRSPREKQISPRKNGAEEKWEEGKRSNDVDGNNDDDDDDASWDGRDSDDSDDDIDDNGKSKVFKPFANGSANSSSPWKSPSLDKPSKKSIVNPPALNLNFSKLSGHTEEEAEPKKSSESGSDTSETPKSKGLTRQRSSSMLIMPSTSKQGFVKTVEATDANPKKPINRRASIAHGTGGGRGAKLNRRGSISGVFSIETGFDFSGKSNLGEHVVRRRAGNLHNLLYSIHNMNCTFKCSLSHPRTHAQM